jgi:hypothetical protein
MRIGRLVAMNVTSMISFASGRIVRSFRQERTAAFRFVAAVALSLCAPSVFAGDMDAVGYAAIAFLVYAGVVIAATIVALWMCKRIAEPRVRALVRLLIVVFLYTPVPYPVLTGQTQVLPAFMLVVSANNYVPRDGILSHPVVLAYAIALLLWLPVVMLWTYVGERYRRIRDTSQIQRTMPASSVSKAAPPTTAAQ